MEQTQNSIGNYQLIKKIGQGGYGQVFKAKSNKSRQSVAIKIHKQFRTANQTQGRVLKSLQGGTWIPKVYNIGNQQGKSYIAMQLLGQSLHFLYKTQPTLFSIEFVASVSIQALKILEFIHSKGFIHRDIKPNQFLFSKRYKNLKLVDFGLSIEYMYVNHQVLSNQSFHVGSVSFASINCHLGYKQSRRDDLESFVYMMIFLATGKLPWQEWQIKNQQSKWQTALLLKNSLSIQQICQDCPEEFAELLRYVRSLTYFQKPDYEYMEMQLRAVSKNLFFSKHIKDYFREKRKRRKISKSARMDQPVKAYSDFCMERVPDLNFSAKVLPSIMDSSIQWDSVEDTVVCELPRIRNRANLEEMKRRIINKESLNQVKIV